MTRSRVSGSPSYQREGELVRDVLEALRAIGVWATRVQSGTQRGGRMHLAAAGTPDVIGYTSSGRLVGIECKLPGGVVSDSQEDWLARARVCGCFVGVARTVEEALVIAQGG